MSHPQALSREYQVGMSRNEHRPDPLPLRTVPPTPPPKCATCGPWVVSPWVTICAVCGRAMPGTWTARLLGGAPR